MDASRNTPSCGENGRKSLIYVRSSTTTQPLDEQIRRCVQGLKKLLHDADHAEVLLSRLAGTGVDPRLAAALAHGIDLLVVEDLSRDPIGPPSRAPGCRRRRPTPAGQVANSAGRLKEDICPGNPNGWSHGTAKLSAC
jgi:hypothetical protein